MNQESKGIAFVSIQLLLIIVYFLYPNSLWMSVPEPVGLIASAIAVLGLVLTTVATIQLNTRLSPFPKPKANAVLIQNGAYKYVRHPIYLGLFLFALGWAIQDGNIVRFGIAFVLLGLLYLKAQYEETLLEKNFVDYTAYKTRTGMLFPKFYRPE